MDSQIRRHQVVISAATVASHATYREGFRQKDIKFLFELFLNWLRGGYGEELSSIQITQISRFIIDLVKEGYAKKIKRGARSPFLLTRLGLIELLSRVVTHTGEEQPQVFFFSYYFIKNYKDRLKQLVKDEGKLFPLSLRLELDTLLDSKAFLESKIEQLERRLNGLTKGIEASYATSKLVQDLVDQKVPLDDLIYVVEKQYPYEFNSQKPLSELITELPYEARLWELQTGNVVRAKHIYEPIKESLTTYLSELKRLLRKD